MVGVEELAVTFSIEDWIESTGLFVSWWVAAYWTSSSSSVFVSCDKISLSISIRSSWVSTVGSSSRVSSSYSSTGSSLSYSSDGFWDTSMLSFFNRIVPVPPTFIPHS